MEFGSIIIVVFGRLGATIVSFPWEATQNVGKYIGKAMKGKEAHSASETIAQIVVLTNRARAEGLLALEEEAKGIEDPFFRKGIELAVDGTDPDALKKTLNVRDRRDEGAAQDRPGVVHLGRHLRPDLRHHRRGVRPHGHDGPAHAARPKVGEGIAGAFVATFWGVFLANGIWLPWANKLKQLSLTEVAHKQLIVEGIMAIQAGVSPRVVEELLKSHIPPSERDKAS